MALGLLETNPTGSTGLYPPQILPVVPTANYQPPPHHKGKTAPKTISANWKCTASIMSNPITIEPGLAPAFYHVEHLGLFHLCQPVRQPVGSQLVCPVCCSVSHSVIRPASV